MRLIFSLCLYLLLAASPSIMADGELDAKLLEKLEKSFQAQGDQTAQLNAIANNSLKNLTLNHELIANHNEFMSLKLKSAGITNQKSSGRCWLFAGLNVFTPNIMNRLDVKEVELSHSYLAFFDKLEKANLFLEQIIALREAPIGDRTLRSVLDSPFGDGGWYSYFTGLVDKYGVVPKSAMPETKQSEATGTINSLTSSLLRTNAAELRRMHNDGESLEELRKRKEQMLADIFQLLALSYGTPPKQFEFRYEPKNDSIKVETSSYTPRSFAKEYFGEQMPEYVALMNDPGRDYGIPFRGEWSRNVWEMDDFTLLNLPIERLKHYTMKSLLDSQFVWFACDVGKEHSSPKGLLATKLYQPDKLLGVDFSSTKADRLAYGDGQASHAMAIMGVDTSKAGQPVKWLVENSWGKKGNDGYWYMYDDWFNEYVYVVIVDKRLIEADEMKMLDQEPRSSELWDPFFQALKNLH